MTAGFELSEFPWEPHLRQLTAPCNASQDDAPTRRIVGVSGLCTAAIFMAATISATSGISTMSFIQPPRTQACTA